MKLSNLLLIFAIALICLFSLQAIWLYNTYQLQLKDIEESVNSLFHQTIEEELDHRFLKLGEKAKVNSMDSTFRTASFEINYEENEDNTVVSQQVTMVRQLMATYNFSLDLAIADSIFHSLLQSNQYPFRYQINHADSANIVLETAGQIVKKGFKTDVFPIINGENIYASIEITSPAVFKNMLAILIASILIFMFIIACLIYEIKIFINQHHIIQLRENFTHALTHDMKTPLSTIHSILVQLESENINSQPHLRQKFNAIAIEQAQNLQTTVNQILILAYIEKNRLSLNKQPIDLPKIIQSQIDKFTIKSNKAITFQTSYNINNCTIYADLFYFKNVISNLIDNAIKYSGDSVIIDIECTVKGNKVYIHVKDNGFGISSNDQLKIFKQFERGAEIKRNQASGFGIGLSYVQQVIEAHGGNVTVLSQEGVGSDFIIVLPL